mmetsp:Transcript_10249/g.35817  ORF Transcript_10249/g.35817 Transcript_10249/m.35817 type:complete len:344 (-) Transcript_10249:182-1213(-)
MSTGSKSQASTMTTPRRRPPVSSPTSVLMGATTSERVCAATDSIRNEWIASHDTQPRRCCSGSVGAKAPVPMTSRQLPYSDQYPASRACVRPGATNHDDECETPRLWMTSCTPVHCAFSTCETYAAPWPTKPLLRPHSWLFFPTLRYTMTEWSSALGAPHAVAASPNSLWKSTSPDALSSCASDSAADPASFPVAHTRATTGSMSIAPRLMLKSMSRTACAKMPTRASTSAIAASPGNRSGTTNMSLYADGSLTSSSSTDTSAPAAGTRSAQMITNTASAAAAVGARHVSFRRRRKRRELGSGAAGAGMQFSSPAIVAAPGVPYNCDKPPQSPPAAATERSVR